MTRQDFGFLRRNDAIVSPSGTRYVVISNAVTDGGWLEVESEKGRRKILHSDEVTGWSKQG